MKRAKQGGYTIIEVLFSIGLVGLLLGTLMEAVRSTSSAYKTGSVTTKLQADARETLDRIAERLRATRLDVIDPRLASPLNAGLVDYQTALGFAGGDVLWGGPRRIMLELDPGELDDGVDKHGDGLVDEGQVVWTDDFGLPTERRTVGSRWVREFLEGEVENGVDDNGNGLIDEPGLSFDFAGETVFIRLTLERQENAGILVTRTAETAVTLRN